MKDHGHQSKNQLHRQAMKRMMTGKYLPGDCDFLRDMIIHHEMALHMSREIYQSTENPRIMEFATNIIYSQEKEIAQMRHLLQTNVENNINRMNFGKLPTDAYSNKQFYLNRMSEHVQQQSEVYHPLVRDQGFHQSMERMHKLDPQGQPVYTQDDLFLHDMLYHHQIAVEMSLEHEKHSDNPTILGLLRKIIWVQSKEIWHMKMMLEHYSNSYWLNSGPSGLVDFPESTFAKYIPTETTSQKINSFSGRLCRPKG